MDHPSPADLIAELDQVSKRLSASYTELSAVKVQYLWLYFQGYKASQESSVVGRDRDAEIAAIAVKEDELTLEGNISALTVERDHLMAKIGWLHAG
jgi:hypothetical protein